MEKNVNYNECKRIVQGIAYDIQKSINSMEQIIYCYMPEGGFPKLQNELVYCIKHMIFIGAEDAEKYMNKYGIIEENEKKELISIISNLMYQVDKLTKEPKWEDI